MEDDLSTVAVRDTATIQGDKDDLNLTSLRAQIMETGQVVCPKVSPMMLWRQFLLFVTVL